MPGQLHEQLQRVGGKIANALNRAGKAIATGTEELKKEAGATFEELKVEGKRGKEWLKSEGLPKAKEKLGEAADVVSAHGDLAARRVGAELREVFTSPAALEKGKAAQFELATLLFNRRVSLSAPMREFLASEKASISNFDNTPHHLRGLPIFPKPERLELLKGEFVPVRIFLTNKGIQARTYSQSPIEDAAAGKPQYKFVEQRAATADDLFQLQISAEKLGDALDAAVKSGAYKEFQAAKKKG